MLGESEMSETTGSCVYLGSNLPITQNPGKMRLCCRGEAFGLKAGFNLGVTRCPPALPCAPRSSVQHESAGTAAPCSPQDIRGARTEPALCQNPTPRRNVENCK